MIRWRFGWMFGFYINPDRRQEIHIIREGSTLPECNRRISRRELKPFMVRNRFGKTTHLKATDKIGAIDEFINLSYNKGKNICLDCWQTLGVP